jgi:hypothetical protein
MDKVRRLTNHTNQFGIINQSGSCLQRTTEFRSQVGQPLGFPVRAVTNKDTFNITLSTKALQFSGPNGGTGEPPERIALSHL